VNVAPGDNQGGGGGSQVAKRNPEPGQQCWGSIGPTLGDNIPVSSSDSSTEVTDILAMTFSQSGGGIQIYGWLYKTKGGQTYIAENASYRSSFEGFLSGIPGLSSIVSGLQNAHGGLFPISSSQGQSIVSSWNAQPNHDAGSCFTHGLA
jgi:hypothetical protein